MFIPQFSAPFKESDPKEKTMKTNVNMKLPSKMHMIALPSFCIKTII